GPVFLAGPCVRAGLVGESPKLLDLQDGDLKMKTDFRRVYATVLEDWLGLPSKPALGGEFAKPLISELINPIYTRRAPDCKRRGPPVRFINRDCRRFIA